MALLDIACCRTYSQSLFDLFLKIDIFKPKLWIFFWLFDIAITRIHYFTLRRVRFTFFSSVVRIFLAFFDFSLELRHSKLFLFHDYWSFVNPRLFNPVLVQFPDLNWPLTLKDGSLHERDAFQADAADQWRHWSERGSLEVQNTNGLEPGTFILCFF